MVNPLPRTIKTSTVLLYAGIFMVQRPNAVGTVSLAATAIPRAGREFLQDSNYNTALDGSDQGGTFGYTVCHQQYFAALSADFLLTPTRPQCGGGDCVRVAHANPMQKVYSWDVMPIQGESGSDSQLGHKFPLHPESGC